MELFVYYVTAKTLNLALIYRLHRTLRVLNRLMKLFRLPNFQFLKTATCANPPVVGSHCLGPSSS